MRECDGVRPGKSAIINVRVKTPWNVGASHGQYCWKLKVYCEFAFMPAVHSVFFYIPERYF